MQEFIFLFLPNYITAKQADCNNKIAIFIPY